MVSVTNGADGRSEDQRLEAAMGHLLRFGVVLAALLAVAGGVMLLRAGGRGAAVDYRAFRGSAEGLTSPSLIWRGVLGGDGAAVIQLGLLVLVATPVARVVLAVAGFWWERDRLYTAVSLAVLGILVWSLVRGG